MKTLFAHQRKGVDLFKNNSFFANFGEMGSGKTAQAAVALAELELANALIICPKSLLRNWESELTEWAPKHQVFVYTGTKSNKLNTLYEFFEFRERAKILVINYESIITKGVERISQVKWQLKVCDESHKLKNRKSKTTKAVSKIPSFRTWIMTGTPTPNNPLEIYSQFDVGKPKYLGANFYSFRAEYADVYSGNGFPQIRGFKNLHRLKAKVDAFSYRVTRDECLDLPKKIYQTIMIEMETSAQRKYDCLADELVLDIFGDGSKVIATPNILTKLVKLQQMTSGFIQDEDGKVHITGSDKIDALIDLVEGVDAKESIAIWTKFTHEIDLIRNALKDSPRKILEISGRIKGDDRHAAVKEFQDGPPAIMIANMAAGGVGITLTRCATVIYFSRSFNSVDAMQSEDRHMRIGQTRNVIYYDLTCKQTVDETIVEALRRKKALADKMSGDDLRRILKGELV